MIHWTNQALTKNHLRHQLYRAEMWQCFLWAIWEVHLNLCCQHCHLLGRAEDPRVIQAGMSESKGLHFPTNEISDEFFLEVTAHGHVRPFVTFLTFHCKNLENKLTYCHCIGLPHAPLLSSHLRATVTAMDLCGWPATTLTLQEPSSVLSCLQIFTLLVALLPDTSSGAEFPSETRSYKLGL